MQEEVNVGGYFHLILYNSFFILNFYFESLSISFPNLPSHQPSPVRRGSHDMQEVMQRVPQHVRPGPAQLPAELSQQEAEPEAVGEQHAAPLTLPHRAPGLHGQPQAHTLDPVLESKCTSNG